LKTGYSFSMSRNLFYFKGLLQIGLLIGLIVACNSKDSNPNPPSVGVTAKVSSPSPGKSISPTMILPSDTPIPLAARVNQSEITLEEYQAELERYKAAKGTDLAPEDEKRVLDDLIDETILAQAAAEKGFVADDAILQEHIKKLIDLPDGEKKLSDWMNTYGYNEESFHKALSRSISAAWMRDQIIEAVPRTAEQIHARQILLYNSDQANQVLSQLEAGNDFGNLAKKYDPITGGDLGWFPRNYLPEPKLEEIAFNLQLNEYSPVIESLAGFHIIQVLERDPQRPLSPDALLTLQSKALQDWLQAQRSEAVIEIFSISP
jgi:parvulin-like peptidyl-prolyl isomerase